MAAANTSIISKIKISDLPMEPKTWKELKTHSKKAEFLLVCQQKLEELSKKGTFEIIQKETPMNNISLLSLIWVFKYKIDLDGYIIKYKSRLVAKEDL